MSNGRNRSRTSRPIIPSETRPTLLPQAPAAGQPLESGGAALGRSAHVLRQLRPRLKRIVASAYSETGTALIACALATTMSRAQSASVAKYRIDPAP